MVKADLLFMTGEALHWYQYKHATGQISTWEQLAADICRRFGQGEYYNSEVAHNKLVQTSSVAAYVLAFERLAFQAPKLQEQSLLIRFITGLKDEVLKILEGDTPIG